VILEAADDADVAVGSRWQSPNSLSEWNLFRRLMTGGGHALTRVVLGLPYDATGAFRAYRLDRIPEATFALVHANSYGFFFESLFVLHVNGFHVREIPIVLPARTYGHSKMTMAAALHSVRFMLGIAARYRRHPDAFRLKAPPNRQERTPV
jgi:dolichol-phosphate mannosyltransferase